MGFLNHKKTAEEFGISVAASIKMRIRYLDGLLRMWDIYEEFNTDTIPEMTRDMIEREMGRLNSQLEQIYSQQPTINAITEEMIEQARAYPIENLLEFKNGKALAFCHEDNSPSLSLWKGHNLARCFPCGKTFNSIDILMDRDNLSFREAVKTLVNS